ncbi:MAG: extracellular solute-binding protein [Firmicutes bacterium]|nr:extracellular solute-binding protein [Bacillota bacterium]
MKKILFSLLTALLVVGFLGCVPVGSTTTTTTATEQILEELPSDEVEITFWHIYGEGKSALLDAMIAEFEAMYPNVTIVSTSQSDYNTLREKINLGISVEQVPTMALGYPDHFAGYITAGAVVSLDQFIESTKVYEVTDSSSSIFGETVSTAIDLSDYLPTYLAENNQYQGGYYYSLPFSKSTETMAVNRDVLKHHITEIRAAGITISDEGFLPHDTPLSYTELALLQDIIVDTSGANATEMQCEYLLNFDSSGNLFINMSRQWNAGYTNLAGEILIDNDTTRNMLDYLDAMFQSNLLVLPINWDQTYGSYNFIYGDVCMTVGSTAGVSYNIPSTAYELSSMKLGIFKVDFQQIPQFVENEDDEFTVSVNDADVTINGSLSAVQQGPNVGIFSKATSAQKLYAMLLIKFLTNTDNTARWAMDTGYLPVRLSTYASINPIELTSTFSATYTEFLAIAQDYWAADADVDWVLTDERWDYLYSSMVANVARYQTEYFQYDPAFAAASSSAGSATARVEAGYCLENIYTLNKSPEEALSFMINQLSW